MPAATTTVVTDLSDEDTTISQWESHRLKTLAEQSYLNNKDLKSSLKYTKRAHRLNPSLTILSDMLTSFTILKTHSETPKPNWYKILNLEPFCHINLIKKSYKKLALSLHPDKNTFVGSEDAFKLVNEAFTVLSDGVKRNEYDTGLRMDMQADVEGQGGEGGEGEVETFWAACSGCKMLHQFERRYLGFSLMCPSCNESFKAVEFVEGAVDEDEGAVDEDEGEGEDSDDDMVLNDYKSKGKTRSVVNVEDEDEDEDEDDDSDDMVLNDYKSKGKTRSVVDVEDKDEDSDDMVLNDYKSKRKTSSVVNVVDEDSDDMVLNEFSSKRKTRSVVDVEDEDSDDMVLNDYNLKRKTSSVGDVMKGVVDVDDEDGDDMVLNDYRSKRKTSSVGSIMRYADDEDSDDMVLNDCNSKRKTSSVGDIMKRSEQSSKSIGSGKGGVRRVSKRTRVAKRRDDEEVMTLAEMRKFAETMDDDDEEEEEEIVRSKSVGVRRRTRAVRNKEDEEMLTLAEMEKLAEMNVDDDEEEEEEEEMFTLAELKSVKTNVNDGKFKVRFKVNEKNKVHEADRGVKNLEIMTVEDSDFYDFDTGRMEKSFKKGQIWALYDDDDGMPRHYGLIEEVVSRRPFEVKMAWLDPQNNGDEGLLSLEKIGFNISCGRFKVSRKTLVQSLNVFSHLVDCERAAREVYRIYPKKGSVWALYSENGLVRDNRSFDIVVFLTSYSEVYGLSMGYLEKVDGFKTIFKRREIGCHAIKWLEKHEVQLFSHQIPARKVSREEVPHISEDCWELDPASLSTELLSNGLLE